MSRALACLTLLAAAASIAPPSAQGQFAPARRPFLFKDNRDNIATAHARGDTALTVVIAVMPGATGQLAQTIQEMGGSIRFRDDQVDYIRARVPVDSVERLAHDPTVHSLDVTMKGADRGFGASGTESFAPADALPLGATPDTGAVWPPKQSDYPLTRRHDPLREMNGVAFRKQHPDCGIGVGGHESQGNFLANYGVRTRYVDNLLITGGYAHGQWWLRAHDHLAVQHHQRL